MLLATFVFLIAMIWNSFTAYLAIEGEPVITDTQVQTYFVLASIAVAIPLGGTIWAFVRGPWVFGILHLLAILVVAGAALIFAVPHDAFSPQPRIPHGRITYTPCYSGSGTCPGG
jgi:hypothetical protein